MNIIEASFSTSTYSARHVMRIYGVKFIIPLLIGSLFGACSPTREMSRTATPDVLRENRIYFIENYAYQRTTVRGDTLVFRAARTNAGSGEKTLSRISLSEAPKAGISMQHAAIIVLRDPASLTVVGDTLLLPYHAIDRVLTSTSNAGYSAGMLAAGLTGIGAIVLIAMGIAIIVAFSTGRLFRPG